MFLAIVVGAARYVDLTDYMYVSNAASAPLDLNMGFRTNNLLCPAHPPPVCRR